MEWNLCEDVKRETDDKEARAVGKGNRRIAAYVKLFKRGGG